MERDGQVFLRHMLDSARKAHARVRTLARAHFDANEDLHLAVAHLIQTVGEAARQVSPATRSNHPEIPWGAIVGMRHKIVHDYVSLDLDQVWSTVQTDLPPLIAQLERSLDI